MQKLNKEAVYEEWVVLIEDTHGNIDSQEVWSSTANDAEETALYNTKLMNVVSANAIPKEEYNQYIRMNVCQPTI